MTEGLIRTHLLHDPGVALRRQRVDQVLRNIDVAELTGDNYLAKSIPQFGFDGHVELFDPVLRVKGVTRSVQSERQPVEDSEILGRRLSCYPLGVNRLLVFMKDPPGLSPFSRTYA
jgi:hypothetical protein